MTSRPKSKSVRSGMSY